ncbi:MAG: FAD-binding oxidoreductase [Elusimicrobiaceae bacterium]|nr:FAD-binding oxidoreductase [Elusimicrobiaceae bacterium]
MHIPAEALRALKHVLGEKNVLCDEISLCLNGYDCSLSRARPDVLLNIPTRQQVSPAVQILHRYKIPFTVRGAATNHAGSCCPLKGGAILNLCALNRILQINTQAGYAWVEPGVITGQLQQALQPLGFFYAPDPASQRVCTIGGNIAQNASGARCLKYGGTLDHLIQAEVVLPNGDVQTFSRTTPGPDWLGLLTGSEGTLGIITQAKVKILPLSQHVRTFLITFPSLQQSVQTVTDLMGRGVIPRCVEAMDKQTVLAVETFSRAGYPTDAEALLILELDGPLQTLEHEQKTVEEICHLHQAQHIYCAQTEAERQRLWAGRQGAYSAMASLAPNVLVCDGTVPRSALPDTLRAVRKILEENQIRASLLFHAGDGNFHPQLIFDERHKTDTLHITRTAKRILQACVDAGGTISGEHGIGVEKRSTMAYQYDRATLHLFSQIKHAADPDELANPLKILPLNYEEKAVFPPAAQGRLRTWLEDFQHRKSQGKPFWVCGTNSRLQTQEPVFSTEPLNQITDVDLTNYTLTVQAGVTLKQVQQTLAKHGVHSVLPDEPGTVGGAFSSGCFPDFYAHVTAIQVLMPDGSLVRYGGKLTKNAAGYNLIRLFAGAQGALGIVTELTFKIFATPQPILTPRKDQPIVPNCWFNRLKQELDPTGLLCLKEETR